MASALAYVHRAEAEAVAIVCRTDTRTDKGTIPADGQMPQTIGRLLERNPGWYLFRAECEHLRIRPPLRTVKGLRSGGQMRADNPPLLRGPRTLAAATGGERRVHILPLVHVVLDVDTDGVRELLRRPRAGRSRRRICSGSSGARKGRDGCSGKSDSLAQFRRGSGGPSLDEAPERKDGVIGQAQQSPERLACGRSLAGAGRRGSTALIAQKWR